MQKSVNQRESFKSGGEVNIYEMEAGRELDTLVAEKVMGLEPASGTRAMMVGVGAPPYYEGAEPGVFGLRHYSTDIAAAWEVWRQIAQRDRWSFQMIFLDALRWSVSTRTYGYGVLGNLEHALWSLEPVDICRAALKTVSQPLPEYEYKEEHING